MCMIVNMCRIVALGIQCTVAGFGTSVFVSLLIFMASKTLNVSFSSLEITLTLLSSFIKFERIMSGSWKE